MESNEMSETLLTSENKVEDYSTHNKDRKMTAIIAIVIIVVLVLIVVVIILSHSLNSDKIPPVAIKLPLLSETPTTMKLGTSRVLEVLFFSGDDDRTL